MHGSKKEIGKELVKKILKDLGLDKRNKQMLCYPIRLQKDEDTYLATSRDFPELTTFGEDKQDALLHAIDALEEWTCTAKVESYLLT